MTINARNLKKRRIEGENKLGMYIEEIENECSESKDKKNKPRDKNRKEEFNSFSSTFKVRIKFDNEIKD